MKQQNANMHCEGKKNKTANTVPGDPTMWGLGYFHITIYPLHRSPLPASASYTSLASLLPNSFAVSFLLTHSLPDPQDLALPLTMCSCSEFFRLAFGCNLWLLIHG